MMESPGYKYREEAQGQSPASLHLEGRWVENEESIKMLMLCGLLNDFYGQFLLYLFLFSGLPRTWQSSRYCIHRFHPTTPF